MDRKTQFIVGSTATALLLFAAMMRMLFSTPGPGPRLTELPVDRGSPEQGWTAPEPKPSATPRLADEPSAPVDPKVLPQWTDAQREVHGPKQSEADIQLLVDDLAELLERSVSVMQLDCEAPPCLGVIALEPTEGEGEGDLTPVDLNRQVIETLAGTDWWMSDVRPVTTGPGDNGTVWIGFEFGPADDTQLRDRRLAELMRP